MTSDLDEVADVTEIVDRSVTLAEARANIGEIVNRAHHEDRWTLITRNGRPAAAVISAEALRFLDRRIDDALAARLAEQEHPAGEQADLDGVVRAWEKAHPGQQARDGG